MYNWRLWRGSHQVFGLVMMLGCVVVALAFILCWRIYAANVPASPGIPDSLAFFIASTFAPIMGATFAGYRDAITAMFPQQGQPPQPVPLHGAIFFYPFALSGMGAALATVFYVAFGNVQMDAAKWFVAGSATYWGSTVGYVFEKLFKRFTVAVPNAAGQPTASPVPVAATAAASGPGDTSRPGVETRGAS